MRRARIAGALAAVGVLLAGCGASTQVSNMLTVAASAPPASLDFTTVGGAAAPQALVGNVYETLVRIDATGTPQPNLATSWDVSDDGTVYTFHLKEGVTFSDGSPFTAHDAVFSINYVKNEWTNGLKAQMDPVAEALALDSATLQVTLSSPSERWLWSMATLTGAMMCEASIPRLATDPLGTGPYTVARFDEGTAITFKARDEGRNDAQIRYFADAASAVNALRAGDVDVVWAMQAPQLLDALPDEIGVQVGTTNGEVLLSMNNNAAPFDDPDVRRAVAHAIDRDALNQVVYNGMATDTGGAPVPPTDPWFSSHNYYPFDPDRARELLAGRTPEITITVPSLPYAQTAAELIFSQLRDVGFVVNLETVEFPAVWLTKVLKGADYQASIIAHVEPRDIPNLFGNADYYLGYDNARVRELITAGDVESMRLAVDQIMDDAGALTLVNAPNIVLTRPGISGVDPNVVTDSLPLANIEVAD